MANELPGSLSAASVGRFEARYRAEQAAKKARNEVEAPARFTPPPYVKTGATLWDPANHILASTRKR